MTRIRFLGCDQDAFCASVARHVAEFEEASGHRVGVQLLDNDEYFTNKLAPYLGGEDPADVYMSGPVLMWEQLGAGYVEPLDAFVDRASLDYDPDDFLKTLIGCNRWNGRFGEPLGKGPLLELPVNCESYNLAYLPAVLQGAGAEVPQTWDDYFAVARRIAAADCRRPRPAVKSSSGLHQSRWLMMMCQRRRSPARCPARPHRDSPAAGRLQRRPHRFNSPVLDAHGRLLVQVLGEIQHLVDVFAVLRRDEGDRHANPGWGNILRK